ncbi:hypothetical protein SEPCBS119000_003620 [Sporothrix epigloea]|uniref:Abc transporter n=1 Tax=Sporothrix epigloea TaxID=1892477 RepID=A0ABP0DMN0_9PEZI
MFKPSSKKDGSSPLLRPDADAVSLHSTHQDADFEHNGSASSSSNRHAAFPDVDDDAPELSLDNDDLPPLYSDVVNEGDQLENGALLQGQNQSQNGNVHAAPGANRFRYPSTAVGEPQKWRYDVALPASGNSADDDVQQLLQTVNRWAQIPPRPYVQLRGTHSQTVEKDGKKETREVVDFDVKVELTPYLYSDARAYQSWCTLRTPDDREKTRRGTVFRCQAPGMSGPPRLGDVEQLPANSADKPSLEDWCRRYCQDSSKLRAFQLERRMTGFDYKRVRSMMETLVGRTNYRGRLQVSFPVDEIGQVYYSEHRFNHWRLSRWIQALCVLSLMIIFTWPYLYFATKRYEVVTVDWPFSRTTPDGRKQYVSLSEEQWYNMWARAITSGVLGKRQATLDQEDLRRAEGAEPTFEPTGNTTVDGALGFVRAGIHAMNQVSRQMGWGGDC